MLENVYGLSFVSGFLCLGPILWFRYFVPMKPQISSN
jgi:hypothetical protein